MVTDAALTGKGGFVCVSNMRMVSYACEIQEYNSIMKRSLMNWPDGKPLCWCGWLWGLRDVRCTRGPNIFKNMMNCGDKRLKHFLIGDTRDVLDEIVMAYKNTADIVGTFSPPFCDENEFDYERIEKMLHNSGANIVWTALTAPKQDIFDAKMSERLPNVVFIGVGRAFRMSIGKIKDAPEWAKKIGVGGMFIGRSRWYRRIWFYVKQSVILVQYWVEILWKRTTGGKYYE